VIDHDPGPLPLSRNAMGGPEPDEHEPYLQFLNRVFTGRSTSAIVSGRHTTKTARELTPEQRIFWLRRHCPRTYALLAAGHHWIDLSGVA